MIHDDPKLKLKREVAEDRACPTCGYNLRGLKLGDKCPECGSRITSGITDPLAGWVITDAGFGYLQALGFGALLMALCAPFILLGLIWTLVEAPWENGLTLWPGGGASMAALGFALGVWITTSPRPTPASTENAGSHMHGEWLVVRWVSRATQLLWIGATPMFVWGADQISEFHLNGTAPHAATEIALWCGAILWVAAFAGLGFLAVYLSRLADWATDTTLADRLRLVPYSLGIGGFIMGSLVLLRGPIGYEGGGLVLMFVGCLGALMLLIAIGTFGWGLLTFANLARWSASSRRAKLATEARRSQIILDRIEAQKAKPIDTHDAVLEGTRPSKPQGKVVQKSGDVQPYDLA
ncbi:MAG TPA: hypothetical protein VD997_17860 [Phycisphaerales bacterium]|nr:hypothetical protein [Phycisphaerales bacterium]